MPYSKDRNTENHYIHVHQKGAPCDGCPKDRVCRWECADFASWVRRAGKWSSYVRKEDRT